MIEYIDAKSLLIKTKNPFAWFGYDYNVNIYKGCSHGCIYCDSRSSCYRVENFDKVKVKKDALDILEKQLSKKRVKGIVGTGAMSDPYNPLEKELKLTRGLLSLLNKYGFGVCITTKSDLILRDIDLLLQISTHSKVVILVTITTFDDELCKKIETNVSVTSKRFEMVKKLQKLGFNVGLLIMPILPYINDSTENIVNIVRTAGELGVKFIYPSFGVTLRDNQREYYYKQLDKKFPEVKEKYLKYYKNSYGCFPFNKKALYGAFYAECKKYNIKTNMKEIINLYKPQISYVNLKFDI